MCRQILAGSIFGVLKQAFERFFNIARSNQLAYLGIEWHFKIVDTAKITETRQQIISNSYKMRSFATHN